MRLLHTSDWHLGKRIEGKSRLEEQREVLEELCRVADENRVDVVLVTGDVFDTFNPPAEAEELFYSYAVRLAAGRCFVAIAGNHDNAERLSAPSELAKYCNMILLGGMDGGRYTRGEIEGGEGYVRIRRGGETLNLALLPYPSYARMSALGYKQCFDTYAEDVKSWIDKCCECFTKDGINVLASHLFMLGTEKSDEAELGTATLLPTGVLPENADYVALGHVHKPQKVSKSKNAYYSGSLLKYSFDDRNEKYFNLVSLGKDAAPVRKIAITSGRNPCRIPVKSFEEAVTALRENANDWVQILYDCALPLSTGKYAELRRFENFCALKNVFTAPKNDKRQPFLHRTDKELFVEYYRREKGSDPSDALVDMFLRAVAGEKP